jgi:cytochrome c oxidase subunit 4
MAHQRRIAPRTYVIICAILVVLTLLTVSVSFFELSPTAHLAAGMSIAVCKAALVALFFMHLLHSDRVTWIVAFAAVFWLGILLVLTLSEVSRRGYIPYMPGH